MPIADFAFENGIFYCREYGAISRQDAKKWADYARLSAAASPTPLVVLIDATEVTSISVDARKVFAKASHIPNMSISAVAAGTAAASREARLTASIAADPHVYIFPTIEEAQAFAEEKASEYRIQLDASV